MTDGIIGIITSMYYGTVLEAKRNKYVMGFYIFGAVWIFIAIVIESAPARSAGLFAVLISSLALGIRYYLKYVRPDIKERDKFNQAFEDIELKKKKSTPRYLSKESTAYTTVYSFKCYNPVKDWEDKKDELEMHINAKIIDVKQSDENKAIIKLVTEIKPLPSDLPWRKVFFTKGNILYLGVGYNGVVGMDLNQYPHAFIAGETGSGKSNILKCMILQAIYKGFEVVLIDFKRGVSFQDFSHYVTICYEYQEAIDLLNALVEETKARLDKFRALKVDNLSNYNDKNYNKPENRLKKKIIFIDELAELLKTRDKETANALNNSIETLTRLSRSVGIHLIMAVQRPDATIISGQIKNNVSYRVCGRFVDKEPSQIMLGSTMANKLPNIKGRFIIKDDNMHEIQCFRFSLDYLKNKKTESKKQPNKPKQATSDEKIETPVHNRVIPITVQPEPTPAGEAPKPIQTATPPEALDTPNEEVKPEKKLSNYDFEFDFSDF